MRTYSKTKRLTVLTMLLAMAITVSLIESTVELGIPGTRLGLANVLGLIALSLFGVKEMFILNIMRVVIVGLMRGTILFSPGFWISFSGSFLISCMAYVAYKTKLFTDIGVSSISSAFHNIGQVMFVAFLTDAPMLLFTYLPFMLLLGIPTGLVSGYVLFSIKQKGIT